MASNPSPRVMRLRAFAAAVLGESDLKVGPRSISLLLQETADHIERMEKRKPYRRSPPVGFRNLRRSG